ncbi:MAG TPA: hypothetical protein VNP04_01375, partial [Alphaproteobacteria bacterium]|nr:hypothetical protein [Alphaproteobacteria bacterium]
MRFTAQRWGRLMIAAVAVVGLVGLSYALLDFDRRWKARAPTGAESASKRSAKLSPADHLHLHFTDVTHQAGIEFIHEAGASGQKWYPETMGAGGGFFDYDGDGWPDILLINGRRWPGERQEP